MKGFRAVAQADELAASELLLDYGGRRYHAVAITELDGERVRKRTEYYNEPFEAPESRSQWAEKM
jgi:hypothetical protein